MLSLFFEYAEQIASITGFILLALVSPGPDFAIIVRNSLIYSRKTALFTALGIALGILVHVAYTLFGAGILIAETPWIFSVFKYLGAGYLLYIGYKGVRAKKQTIDFGTLNIKKDISAFAAIRSGFLTNALNPKAMLFFISLFSVVISPGTPLIIMLLYAVIIFTSTLIWFSCVAFFLSGKRTREYFSSIGYIVERITGGLLLLLGIKLLFHKP